jgi:hypothetical protein
MEEFYVPLSATVRCWGGGTQFPAEVVQRSTIDDTRFSVYEKVLLSDDDDGEGYCRSLFHVSFLALETCSVRISGSAAIYFVSETFKREVRLLGENTHVEIQPRCCSAVPRPFEAAVVLAPGEYNVLALLEVGLGGGHGLLSLDVEFSAVTGVEQGTWSVVKQLYR